jgi:thioredoxin reductase (NADPH)
VLYPEKFIYDVPGFPKIQGRDLVKQLVEQAMTFHPEIRLEEQVQNLTVHGERDIELTTSKGSYRSRSVLISAGVGAFSPNRIPVPGLEQYEGHGIYYFVKEKAAFRGKRLLIVGGGDSAVDWALNLKDYARQITLIHRRDQFRAHEHTVAELRAAPVDIKLFYELKEVHGNGKVEAVTIFNNQTKEEEELPIDAVLAFLGFKADAGPIKNWGLEMEGRGRAIKVGPNYETSLPGVFAAGDIAGAPVKLDLIAVCFGQAAVAVNSAKAYVDPKAKVFPGHSSEMRL